MAEIILNSKYAPGVSTYGAEGRKGKNGKNGNSIFFVPFNIKENENIIIEQYIIPGKVIGLDKNFNYTYQYGDTFIQPDGKVYMYGIYKEENNNETFFSYIGNIGIENDNCFSLKNDYIINKNGNNLLLTNNTQTNVSPKSILNIENINENANFLYLKSKDSYMSFNYDNKNKSFYVKSDNYLLIDKLYGINTTNFKPFAGYFPVLSDVNIVNYLDIIIDTTNNIASIKVEDYLINDFIFNFCCMKKNDGITHRFILNDSFVNNYSNINYSFDIKESNFYLELSSIYNFTNKIVNINIPSEVNFDSSINDMLLNIKIQNANFEKLSYYIVLYNDIENNLINITNDDDFYSIKDYKNFYILCSYKNKKFFWKSQTFNIETSQPVDPNPEPIVPTPIPTPPCSYDCGYDCSEDCFEDCYLDCFEKCVIDRDNDNIDDEIDECVFDADGDGEPDYSF